MCRFEKGCHEECLRCDDYYKLEEELEELKLKLKEKEKNYENI